jgi:TctA family transporter
MWVGNLMLVVINLPLVGIWVRLLSVPYRILFPAIVVFCGIGVFSVNNSAFEVGLASFFAIVGYVLLKLGCEPAPLALGFVLGPLMEEYFRRTMQLSRGDATVFLTSPISLTLLLAAAGLLLTLVVPNLRKARDTTFQD